MATWGSMAENIFVEQVYSIWVHGTAMLCCNNWCWHTDSHFRRSPQHTLSCIRPLCYGRMRLH